MANTPSFLSAALTLPKVNSTRPSLGNCILASYAACWICSYLLISITYFYKSSQPCVLFIAFCINSAGAFFRLVTGAKAMPHGIHGIFHFGINAGGGGGKHSRAQRTGLVGFMNADGHV